MLSPDTEIHQDSKELFGVMSRVTITGQEAEEVTCQIQNNMAQAEKTTVRLSSESHLWWFYSPGQLSSTTTALSHFPSSKGRKYDEKAEG